jgi:L-lactate dehydrogenase complex protein LldG
MERSEFLARVKTAESAAILPTSPDEDPGQWVPALPEVDLVERFAEMAQKAAVEVHTGSFDDVLAEVVERYAIANYISWDVDRIDGVEHLPDGLRRIGTETRRGVEGRAEHNAGYMDCQLGITGVPLVHIAVLGRDRIFRSASHWAADPSSRMSEGSNVVFITGPSKTADIESIVTLGVHGPKHLHVVLV